MKIVPRREWALVSAIVVLCGVLAWVAPPYFSTANLLDMFLTNLPALLIAVGMTLVILAGQIDISVGSIFAVAGVAAGVFAKLGMPIWMAASLACLAGAILGAINGALVAYARVPSIVATLASMVALRDALRWATQGAWIEDLPGGFQWLGLPQAWFPAVTLVISIFVAAGVAWGLRNLGAGRAVYATGSNEEAARLMGIPTSRVTFLVFVILGLLTGLAAVLNSVRFNQIPTNAGLGLEMKVIAAVVLGGAAITGGAGTVGATVLGMVLLSAIGPALTFLGIDPAWEKAVQGGIILVCLAAEVSSAPRVGSALKFNASGINPKHA